VPSSWPSTWPTRARSEGSNVETASSEPIVSRISAAAGPREISVRGSTDTILFVLAAAVFLLAGLGAYPLWDPDEGRHAEIARRLGSDGQWLVPRIYGEPYYDKPTFFYWIVRASFTAFGTNALAARLPSVLATLGTLVVLHRFALARFGRRAAAHAATIYLTSPLVIVLSRYCNLDATLTFFVTWACAAWLGWLGGERERPPWNAYAAMALGTLVKGPIAVLLPALTVVLVGFTRGRGDALALLRAARPMRGALVIAALVVPWLAGTALAEPDYLRTFLVEHNFRRYLSGEFEHVKNPAYFFWVLPLLLLPWSLLVPAVVRDRRDSRPEGRTDGRDLLIWAAVVVGFFSFGRAKLAPYVLPAVAPLVVWLGAKVADLDPAGIPAVRRALSAWAGALLVVPIAVGGWVATTYPALTITATWSLVVVPVAAAALWAAHSRTEHRTVPVLALGNAALFTVFYLAAGPAVSAVASDASLAKLASRRPEIAVASFRVQPASFSFYSEREVMRFDETRDVVARIHEGPLLLVSRRRHEATLAQAGIPLHEWLDTGRHVLWGTVPPPTGSPSG
jgi:4-amino-4-deoxy-L-arabinose transferase-like glycosyltransferase